MAALIGSKIGIFLTKRLAAVIQILMILAVTTLLLALAAAIWTVLRAFGSSGASLGTGALIVAILSVPLVAYNTYLRHRALGFQKEGHLTDRLAKAVEQLGAEKTVKKIVEDKDGNKVSQETTEPNLEVRIGGLLSLERIAQDSTNYDKGRDHVRVMEIICAYIRHNASAGLAGKYEGDELEDLPDGGDEQQRTAYLDEVEQRYGGGDSLSLWLATLKPPRDDIMLALTILERRSPRQREIEAAHGQEGAVKAVWVFDEKYCPEFPNEDSDLPLDKEILKTFQDELKKWRRELASYSGYRLDLRGCCLQGAALAHFRLGGARLDGTRLEGADLWEARLQGADLWEARLQEANLGEARLDEATDLKGADFPASSLRSVELSSVAITQEQINSSFGDASVTLPKDEHGNLKRAKPKHWPDQELDWLVFDQEWHRWRADPANYKPPQNRP